MIIRDQLENDIDVYGRCVYLVVDGWHEYRVVRLNPMSTTYIEENDDAYIRS